MPTRSTTNPTPSAASARSSTALPAPFTTGQQAVLQLLSRPLSEKQLTDIKKIIEQYLAGQTDALAQQAWQEKGYTQADMDTLLTTHVRTPYKKR